MAAGGIAAAGAALGGLASAFGNQSRGSAGSTAPRSDTSTAALALASSPKMARELRKNARDERMLAVLLDPQVLGLLVTFGGLAAASRIPFHPDPDTNTKVQGLAAAAAVLMGLGRAGVGDLTTLTMAAGAGAVVGTAGNDWTIEAPGGYPLASLWGPLAGIQWAIKQANRG